MPEMPDIRPGAYVLDTHALLAFLQAAQIKAHHTVSYADAFAIALAQELNATLVTGDPEIWATHELVPLLWI